MALLPSQQQGQNFQKAWGRNGVGKNPYAFPKIHVFLHVSYWIRKHLEKVKSFFCLRYPFMYKMLPSSSNY